MLMGNYLFSYLIIPFFPDYSVNSNSLRQKEPTSSVEMLVLEPLWRMPGNEKFLKEDFSPGSKVYKALY